MTTCPCVLLPVWQLRHAFVALPCSHVTCPRFRHSLLIPTYLLPVSPVWLPSLLCSSLLFPWFDILCRQWCVVLCPAGVMACSTPTQVEATPPHPSLPLYFVVCLLWFGTLVVLRWFSPSYTFYVITIPTTPTILEPPPAGVLVSSYCVVFI